MAARSITIGQERRDKIEVQDNLLDGVARVKHLLKGDEARFVRNTLERREEAIEDGVEFNLSDAQIKWLISIHRRFE